MTQDKTMTDSSHVDEDKHGTHWDSMLCAGLPQNDIFTSESETKI